MKNVILDLIGAITLFLIPIVGSYLIMAYGG